MLEKVYKQQISHMFMENEKVYLISDILTNTCNFPFTEYESH